jgi:dTDP-4-amino-4,6-dideoxygalactose transaminase
LRKSQTINLGSAGARERRLPGRGEDIVRDRPAPRILGGMFGLPDLGRLENQSPPFLTGQEALFVNGRSSIHTLVRSLPPTTVWVPSYLCRSLFRAAWREDGRIRFYEVDYDLAIPSLQWLEDVQECDLVVFIDFFGFPSDLEAMKRARTRGAWVLEDACQALLSRNVGLGADFSVFSPRKFLGVPDGGILRLNCGVDLERSGLESPPAHWWLQTLRASVLRREFDVHGGEELWFELFQGSEDAAPLGRFAMSELSRALLKQCFDYAGIAERRRSNYAVLSEALADLAIFPKISEDVVPLGFPVRAPDRDRLRQTLFRHHIYPPVHWPIEGVVPEQFRASHRLAAHILTLPCDQRYESADMERMADLVLEASRS